VLGREAHHPSLDPCCTVAPPAPDDPTPFEALVHQLQSPRVARSLCAISLSSVGRYIRRYRATGSVSPEKFGGYKDYALAKYAERIKRWIARRPDQTLLELQARLATAGVKVAASSMFRSNSEIRPAAWSRPCRCHHLRDAKT